MAENPAADLSAIFAMPNLGCAQADPATRRFLRVNRAFCEITGYAEGELLTMTVNDLNHPDDQEFDSDQYQKLGASGSSGYQIEKRYLRKDRSIIWVSVHGNLVRDEAGRPLRTLALVRDITSRKRTEAERHMFVSLAENSPEFIAMCDLDAAPFYVNEAGLRLVGLPTLEAAKRAGVGDFFYPEDRDFILGKFFPEVTKTGHGQVEVRFKRFDNGEPIWMLYNVVLLKAPTGEPVGYATISSQIDARKKAEDALRQSEERFRLLVEQLPFSLQVVDPTGRTVRVNRAFVRLWGITFEQLVDYNLLKDEQLTALGIMPYIRRAFAGEAVEIPPRPYVPDRGEFIGQERWTRTIVYPVRGDGGALHEVVLIHEDVTERKRSEQAVRESEERLRIATRTGKVGVWEWHITTQRITWTDSLYAMHGVDPKTFTPTIESFTALVHPDDRERVRARIRDSMERDVPYETTMRVVRPDGSVVWLFTNAIVLRQEGKPARMLGATTDVTKLKETELELQSARDELKRHAESLEREVADRTRKLRETVAELEGFSYSIAHDMRAPLRSMSSYSTILAAEYSDKLDAEGRDFLRRISGSAGRMDRLIQDVLSYSRILRADLPLESVDFQQLAAEIIQSYPHLQEPSATITLRVLPTVRANPALLTQVISNLLGNAVKFVAAGVKPDVLVRADAPRNRRVRIWFEDNGIGIAREHRDRIFQIFQRLNPPDLYEGTGIGLSIVRKAVERMGGEIGLESEPGRGSRFWIELTVAE